MSFVVHGRVEVRIRRTNYSLAQQPDTGQPLDGLGASEEERERARVQRLVQRHRLRRAPHLVERHVGRRVDGALARGRGSRCSLATNPGCMHVSAAHATHEFGGDGGARDALG